MHPGLPPQVVFWGSRRTVRKTDRNTAILSTFMYTTAYEISIGELCQRLDELARGVSDEFARHQQRIQALRELESVSNDSTEVRGAVLTSALSLLEAVDGLKSQVAEVRQIILQQQELLNSLHTESRTDALTGQLNRRAFDEELSRRSAESRRTGNPLGLVLIDIDHFKFINDNHGHAAGDKVLRGVSNVLTNSLRDMDVVARYGGEEFALLLPDTSLLNACRAAERARAAVGSSVFLFDEVELTVTISAGVTIVESRGERDIKHADDAMYAAKQAGRDRVFAYKDGYCQPLHREPTGEHGAQRRRSMRFLVEGVHVRICHADIPWCAAEVYDESLTGIGVKVPEEVALRVGEILDIDYYGEQRRAELMHSTIDPKSGATQMGLRWCET